jgi:HEAT repeat protein
MEIMALDEIFARLRNAEDEIERTKAAEQLGDYEGEQVILALIQAMGDEDDLVRAAAKEGLKKCRSDPTLYLQHALEDVKEWIRWGAAELLAYFPSPESEAGLHNALEDRSPDVRGAAARSLRGMVKEQATVLALRKLLDDPESYPRYQALRTLRAFDPQLVDEAQMIRRDLESDDALTRVAAVHFIREEGRREWLGEIAKMLDDPDFRVGRAAQWAWERLGKETI